MVCGLKSVTDFRQLLKSLSTPPGHFFFTRVGLADKVGFFFFALETEAIFWAPPAFWATFCEESGRPFLGFSVDGFRPFVFPVNLVDNPDFFFDSYGGLAGAGLGIASDEDSLGILTIFFPDLPIPLPEDPVGLGNGNEGSFFFFKASPENTRTWYSSNNESTAF